MLFRRGRGGQTSMGKDTGNTLPEVMRVLKNFVAAVL